jgi:hypothetical protein
MTVNRRNSGRRRSLYAYLIWSPSNTQARGTEGNGGYFRSLCFRIMYPLFLWAGAQGDPCTATIYHKLFDLISNHS